MVKISQAQTPVGSIQGGAPLSRVITNPDDDNYDNNMCYPECQGLLSRSHNHLSHITRLSCPARGRKRAERTSGTQDIYVLKIRTIFQNCVLNFPETVVT